MLDETKPCGRIVAAALKLASERPWREITMRDIAEAASVGLADLRREFSSKGAILAAFTRAADDALLARSVKPAAGQSARDRLFDVIMTRFDVLAPYKAGLKSIAAAQQIDLPLAQSVCASQAWMLHAAGINTDGLLGPARVAGLASVYGSVFSTWLADDDPGLGRTMAALDRRLKRGEQAIGTLNEMCSGVCKLVGVLRSGWRTRGAPEASSAPAAGADEAQGPIGYGRA